MLGHHHQGGTQQAAVEHVALLEHLHHGAGCRVGRIGLAVAPNNPSVVYALLDNQAPKPDAEQYGKDKIIEVERYFDAEILLIFSHLISVLRVSGYFG